MQSADVLADSPGVWGRVGLFVEGAVYDVGLLLARDAEEVAGVLCRQDVTGTRVQNYLLAVRAHSDQHAAISVKNSEEHKRCMNVFLRLKKFEYFLKK